MDLWKCIECGCQAIARDLRACPQCFKPKKEQKVPKITREGGPSNAAADAEQAERDEQDAKADKSARAAAKKDVPK